MMHNSQRISKKSKILFFFLVIIIFNSCKNYSELDDKNTTELEIIPIRNSSDLNMFYQDQDFENNEAYELNNLGIQLIKQNEFRAAEQKFIAAYRLEPENPTILNNLGNIYREIGTERIAREYFRDALIVSDSSYINAAYNMGISYCASSDFKESEEILNFVLSVTDNETWIIMAKYALSNVYFQQQKCAKAKKIYQEIKNDITEFSEFVKSQSKFEAELENCAQQRI